MSGGAGTSMLLIWYVIGKLLPSFCDFAWTWFNGFIHLGQGLHFKSKIYLIYITIFLDVFVRTLQTQLELPQTMPMHNKDETPAVLEKVSTHLLN